MVVSLLLIFLFIFTFGDYFSTLLSSLLYRLEPVVLGLFGKELLLSLPGAIEGSSQAQP